MADLTANASQEVEGDFAHDAVDAGSPVKMGGYASASAPSAVSADGDRVNAWFSRFGRLNASVGTSGAATDATSNTVLYPNDPGEAQRLGVAAAFAFNGSTWDRVRTSVAINSTVAETGVAAAAVGPGFQRRVQQAAISASGAQAAVDVGSASIVAMRLAGTYTALTYKLQASFDGTNWVDAGGTMLPMWQSGNGGSFNNWAAGSRTPGNNDTEVDVLPVQGARLVRINVVSIGSGSITVDWTVGVGAPAVTPTLIAGASGTSAVADIGNGTSDDQAGKNALAVFGQTYVYDGTNWDRWREAAGTTGAGAVGGLTASDGVLVAAPVTVGGRASSATPSAVSTDGDVVDAWFDRRGQLQVTLRDTSGNPVSVGGGTQYTEDAALGAVGSGIGTLGVGRASAAAPTSVSADGDAVGLWASRFGALNVILRDISGQAVATGTQYVEDVAIGTTGTGTLVGARRDDALAALTPVQDDFVGLRVGDKGALWVQIADGSGNQITSFGGGTQYVGDAAATSTPTGTMSMGLANTSAPANVSANNDAVALWALQNGSLNVVLRDTAGASVTNVAAALADGAANPTVAGIQMFPMVWNNATWDRWKSVSGFADTASTGIAGVGATIFNGATWDRMRTASGDGLGATGILGAGTVNYNGATWDRVRNALAYPGIVTTFVQGTSATAQVDPDSNLTGGISALRDRFVAQRQVLFEEMFDVSARADAWTTTTANGGTVTTTSGLTTVATSANANGSAIITTQQLFAIKAGAEYEWSAVMRVGDTGLANNARRWGIFSQSAGAPQDGYYFELTGTTLNAVSAVLGTPTAVAVGSWTRNANAPFTPDTNLMHRWSIRFTGDYVLFSIDGIVRHVLTQVAVSNTRIGTRLLPITFQSTNTASAATNENISLESVYLAKIGNPTASVDEMSAEPNRAGGVAAAGMGPGFDIKTDPTGITATSTSNAIVVPVNGADVISFAVTTIGTTPGGMIVEYTNDGGTTWKTHGAVLLLGNVEAWVQGQFVPAVGDVYMVRTVGLRKIRVRVNAAYASGTFTAKFTASTGAAMVKTIDVGPAPHNIGYAIASAGAQFTTTQTSTTLGPTVSSTQRLVVTYIQIQTGGTTAGAVQVYFGTGAFTRGTNKAIFDGEFAPSATAKPGFSAHPPVPWIGAADEELKVTDSAAINPLTVTIWYYLIAA